MIYFWLITTLLAFIGFLKNRRDFYNKSKVNLNERISMQFYVHIFWVLICMAVVEKLSLPDLIIPVLFMLNFFLSVVFGVVLGWLKRKQVVAKQDVSVPLGMWRIFGIIDFFIFMGSSFKIVQVLFL
jgi:hypothetical protein